MSRMIQLRHVPDALHRKLKSRAALEGLSLSDYLLRIVKRDVEQPTLSEMLDRLAALPPVRTRESAAEAVAAERRR